MDTWSVKATADSLGTSIPRVHRALAALNLHPRRSGRGMELSRDEWLAVRRQLGAAPVIAGFTREDMFILRALSLRPFGFRSARAAARAAGVSPTSATLSLNKLVDMKIVAKQRRRVTEGSVVDVDFFDIGERWWDIVDAVREVTLPVRRTGRPGRPKRVPPYLRHHFWNANAAAIDVQRHEGYVASRLIRSGDPEAIAWTVCRLGRSAIESAATERGLSETERARIRLLAAGARK